ncbi:hypothetical protein EJ07DRAFT_123746 [Lizonia empirigonia]|nr:hypothetical protein EJ07DRAFT_123746 [Lizonia empirigonia]
MIELTTNPLGPAHEAIYHDAVEHFDTQPTKPGNLSHATVFLEAIKPMTESLEKQLGHPPVYKSLFVLSIFHSTVRDAAEGILTEDQLDQPFRLGWAREATCPGYGFLECRNLGRTREECVDGGPVNLIIALEYEKEYLYAWLMEVEFELQTYPAMHSGFCRECGERNSASIGTQQYKQRVTTFLSDFVQEALHTHYLDAQRENIRTIILSGEASPPRATELGEMACKAVGTETARVMTDIDPAEVVAHGAAVWARLVQQFPRTFVIETGNRVDEVVGRDEL